MKHLALILTLLIATLAPTYGRGVRVAGGYAFSGRHSYRAYRTKSYSYSSYASRAQAARRRTYSQRRSYHRARRSRAARAAFMRQHPCPSTGRTYGACPGWLVDHVKPLACGGADAPANMNWQTIAEGKAKDKWERKGPGCR
jgi:5-methylcytosine-specific restriction endonuclease McrA